MDVPRWSNRIDYTQRLTVRPIPDVKRMDVYLLRDHGEHR